MYLRTLIQIQILWLGLACGAGGKDPIRGISPNLEEDLPGGGDPGGSSSAFSLSFELYEKLETYDSCQEIRDDLNRRIAAINERYADERERYRKAREMNEGRSPAMDSAGEDASDSGPVGDEESITNIQEKGIDESDFVKRNQFHIYVLHGNTIEVVDRKSLAILGQINTGLQAGPSRWWWARSSTPVQIYADGHRLIVVGPGTVGEDATPGRESEGRVKIYETTDGNLPVLLADMTMPGSLVESRFISGIFYGVYGDAIETEELEPSPPEETAPKLALSDPPSEWGDYYPAPPKDIGLKEGQFTETTFRGRACQGIVKPAANDWNLNVTHVLSINSRGPEPAQTLTSVSLLNSNPGDIYVGQGSIYTYGYNFHAPYYADRGSEITALTEILYDRESGKLTPVARGIIPGVPGKEQWSFRQFSDGQLGVVTTTFSPIRPDGITISQDMVEGRNHLWLLKPAGNVHEITGSVINFGKPFEDVRSVRYIDEKAYIVTFEKTDPLYTITLSDRTNPMIEDALEIPGFSMYMHPLTDRYLVGIGYDAVDMGSYSLFQGIQVSLFDIADGSSSLVEKHVYGERGSSSDVTGDHRAFYFNKDDLTFAMPLTELTSPGGPGGPGGPGHYGTELKFAGAIIFSLATTGQTGSIVEKARVSHQDLIPEECKGFLARGRWWQSKAQSLDINRMFKNEGQLLSVSRFGIKAHDLNSYAHLKTVAFGVDPGSIPECMSRGN